MAKKFVRGITDIKNIEHQDFDTNNVNDLLSDGKHNFIHRKKQDGSEEYHNLTNNLKTIEAVPNGLLTVTNNNNTTNTAELEVHHDQAKSQLLGSPDQTIIVQNGENGSAELTTVDVNPAKVLTHDNLKPGYGIYKTVSGNNSILGVTYTKVEDGFDLNTLASGFVRGVNLTNAPSSDWFFVEAVTEDTSAVQKATALSTPNTEFVRLKNNGTWGEWREQIGDKSAIDTLLAQKQNTIQSNYSIGVAGTGLRQLYTKKETYNVTDGFLKTHVKSLAGNTTMSTGEEEFNFIVKINEGATSVSFTLNDNDKSKFENILSTYGQNGSVNISGCVFTLSDVDLTVSTSNNVDDNYVITFSDII